MLYPEIKEIWWAEVRKALRETRTLITPLGWKRQFYGRWDNVKFFNEGLAFVPQCTVGVLAEIGMLAVPKIDGAETLLNEHDAVLGECDDDRAEDVIPAVCKAMEIPIKIHGRSLTIPAEAKVGLNWSEASSDNPNGLEKWTGKT
jgi:hypothetical protein